MYFFLIIFFSFLGCSFPDRVIITAVLPEIPEHWSFISESIEFELCYFFEGDEKIISGCSPGENVEIKLEKGIVSVLALPYHPSFPLFPAGGIFPVNCCDEKLNISWENGFAASVLYNLMEKGLDFPNFNIKRFESKLLDKSENNPWHISEMEIIFALSSSIFNSNFIRCKESFSIILNAPFFEGEWVLSDSMDLRIFKPEGGSLVLDNIYKGHYFLFRNDRYLMSDTFVELFIEDDSWKAFFSNSQGGQSGNM